MPTLPAAAPAARTTRIHPGAAQVEMDGLHAWIMGLAVAPPWVSLALPHVVVGLFVFAYGACVGSFLNVLIYRLPEGISVISPPSRCPVCGALLGWGENLPIVGWLWLRGRCKRCAAPISPQYIAIETLTGLLFVALYLAYFATSPHAPWWGQVGGPWWYAAGPLRGLPAFTLHAFLLAALLAMTLIDARTFTIPIQIPVALTIVAFLLWPLQGLLVMTPRTMTGLPIPVVDWRWFAVASGGMLGVGVAVALLRGGVIRPSFADYDDFVEEGEALGDYPHARREMGVEAIFLLPVTIGVAIGWLVGGALPVGHPPLPLALLGGSMLGYLVGAGIVWAVRMLGTLGFGREAMGLGDVHLLAAVGSVLGWRDPLWIFFLAPFPGLLWALLSRLLAGRFAGFRRELPYGPHLAVATVLVVFCRPAVNLAQDAIFPPRQSSAGRSAERTADARPTRPLDNPARVD